MYRTDTEIWSQESPPSWSCILHAFYPSDCWEVA